MSVQSTNMHLITQCLPYISTYNHLNWLMRGKNSVLAHSVSKHSLQTVGTSFGVQGIQCAHVCVCVCVCVCARVHVHPILTANSVTIPFCPVFEFSSFSCWYFFPSSLTGISCPLMLRYSKRASWMNTYCFCSG